VIESSWVAEGAQLTLLVVRRQCDTSTPATLADDLHALGLLILRCMEQPSKRKVHTVAEVQEFMKQKKLFGLSNSERWSGCKQLVDFIEDLFSDVRPAPVKVQKPVRRSHS
jgi:hypothetical protein